MRKRRQSKRVQIKLMQNYFHRNEEILTFEREKRTLHSRKKNCWLAGLLKQTNKKKFIEYIESKMKEPLNPLVLKEQVHLEAFSFIFTMSAKYLFNCLISSSLTNSFICLSIKHVTIS